MSSWLPDSAAAAPRHHCRGDQAEEDYVRQAEEGVVQAVSGVNASTSVALLRRRRRRCRRRHRCRCRRGAVPSLSQRCIRWVCRARRQERRCRWSIRHDSVVVDDNTADGGPNMVAMATRPDGGVNGGSSTDRDNNDHNTDGNRRHRRRPRPRRVAAAVAMMTIAGERGGEATARQLQSGDEVTERQSATAPARARLIEFVMHAQGL